jgi:glycosyltransferase involved in cell wall biosynthesis
MQPISPLVTVDIVVLNREWVIDKMLTSLQRQTYPHDRIFVIVVDGESKDKTVPTAERI